MSTRPNLSTAALTILSQFSSELGRSAMISASPPSFSHSVATFFSSSVLLAASTTLAPAPANVFAASAPKAPDAPVMMAVLPLMSNSDRGSLRNSSDIASSRYFLVMAGLVPAISFRKARPSWSRSPGQAGDDGPRGPSLRRGGRDQNGANILAAVDDFAVFVRRDEAGISRPGDDFLAPGDHRQLAFEHVIDFFRR